MLYVHWGGKCSCTFKSSASTVRIWAYLEGFEFEGCTDRSREAEIVDYKSVDPWNYHPTYEGHFISPLCLHQTRLGIESKLSKLTVIEMSGPFTSVGLSTYPPFSVGMTNLTAEVIGNQKQTLLDMSRIILEKWRYKARPYYIVDDAKITIYVYLEKFFLTAKLLEKYYTHRLARHCMFPVKTRMDDGIPAMKVDLHDIGEEMDYMQEKNESFGYEDVIISDNDGYYCECVDDEF
jgi:hypothetical protein